MKWFVYLVVALSFASLAAVQATACDDEVVVVVDPNDIQTFEAPMSMLVAYGYGRNPGASFSPGYGGGVSQAALARALAQQQYEQELARQAALARALARQQSCAPRRYPSRGIPYPSGGFSPGFSPGFNPGFDVGSGGGSINVNKLKIKRSPGAFGR